MPPLRHAPGADPPAQVCSRCSKPITPRTGSQLYGRAIHIRCLAGETVRESIEQQDRASLERGRAQTAMGRAEELIDAVRRIPKMCPVCGERFGAHRGVLFQGDALVHAACWQPSQGPDRPAEPAPRRRS
jgi:hypothetical protein